MRSGPVGGGGAAGSATVELVFVVPFVLLLLAAVWDVRQYIGYRTELAREMYVVAEAIADHTTGPAPFELVVAQAVDRLDDNARSGVVRAAVIVRGSVGRNGLPCVTGEWCPPMVSAAWPPVDDETSGRWSRDEENVCAVPSPLPAIGDHFGTLQKVLPDEGGDGEAEDEWISRNMSETEWWVVVDTCVDPQPGLFIGTMANAAARMLDTSFALSRRATWGSIHDKDDCEWCG